MYENGQLFFGNACHPRVNDGRNSFAERPRGAMGRGQAVNRAYPPTFLLSGVEGPLRVTVKSPTFQIIKDTILPSPITISSTTNE